MVLHLRMICLVLSLWILDTGEAICVPPPIVVNGMYTPIKDNYTDTDTVTYVCDTGYTHTSGDLNLTCATTDWVGTTPTCTGEAVCVPPPKVVNGMYTPIKDNYTDTDTVTYACDTGYTHTSGDLNLTCATTDWVGTTPTCTGEAICVPPPIVVNGMYTPIKDNYTDTDTVTYACDTGYTHTSGDLNLTCATTDWVGTTPTCTAPCGENKFQCLNGRCIRSDWVCDGDIDCNDRSDENNCSMNTCGEEEFQCLSGNCIVSYMVCNGYIDCRDRSDENNCSMPTCGEGQFTCLDGNCIGSDWVCDGDFDCNDRSDENYCNTSSCSDDEFRCLSGRCIILNWVCDSYFDCEDKSDELNCTSCPGDRFRCLSAVCIDPTYVCDGLVQCEDESDEQNCTSSFRCHSGRSNIDSDRHCNGVVDCDDESDELHCPIDCNHAESFHCDNNNTECVNHTVMCNGRRNCQNGFDEEGCASCQGDSFLCHSGRCIRSLSVCDGEVDCDDESDELNCTIDCKDSSSFHCDNNNTECVNFTVMCDGRRNCRNGFDEEECVRQYAFLFDCSITTNYGPYHDVYLKPVKDDTEILDLCRQTSLPSISGILSKKSCFVVTEKECRAIEKGKSLVIEGEVIQRRLNHYLDIPQGFFSAVLGLRVKTGNLTHADFTWDDGSPLTYTNWTMRNYQQLPKTSKIGCFCLTDSSIWINFLTRKVEIPRKSGFPFEMLLHYRNSTIPLVAGGKCIYMEPGGMKWTVNECLPQLYPLRLCLLRTTDNITDNINTIKLQDIQEENMLVDPYMYFACNSGDIILSVYVCDTVKDCFDNSDEIHCDKNSEIQLYACDDGTLINIGLRCDFYRDCRDRSDETNCVAAECTIYEWRCYNGQCVTFDLLCDNKFDCRDHSDEGFKACSGNCEDRELHKCGDSSQKCITRSVAQDGVQDCGCDGDEPPPIDNIRSLCGYNDDYNGYINVGEDLFGTLYVRCRRGYTEIELDRFTQTHGRIRYFTYESNITIVTFNLESSYLVNKLYNISRVCWQVGDLTYQTSDNRFKRKRLSSKKLKLTWPYKGHFVFTSSTVKIKCYEPYAIGNVPTMMCKSGKTRMFARHKCLLNIKPDGAPYGCRDLTHLENCEDFSCPSNYVKCPDSFCLHVRLVCDGQPHCPHSEDERDCEKYECKGMFRCRKSRSCLPHDLVCDGIRQCPHGEDERLCGFECPSQCACKGVAFIRCNSSLPFDSAVTTAKHVRYLDLSNSVELSSRFSELSVFQSLIVLNISRCRVQAIMSNSGNKPYKKTPLQFLKSLRILDLSHNMLEHVTKNDFSELYFLQKLFLTGNTNLVTVESGSFNDLKKVTHLHIENCDIKAVDNNTFRGMNSLKYLYLNFNPLHIQTGSFQVLPSLLYLDIRGATVDIKHELFNGIEQLDQLQTDSSDVCCVMKTVNPLGICIAPANAISSCENLIENDLLRLCIWIIGFSAMLGNVFVIVYHIKQSVHIHKWHSYTVFVTFLGVSDLFMGIYTLIIASTDVHFRGDYGIHDMTWRNSLLCTIAGILSAISCESSAMLICLIAVDRYLAVRFPFSKLTPSQALILGALATIIATGIAVFPVTTDAYFGGEFYSNSGVCIALPLTGRSTKGWQYSVGVFIVFNAILFTVIGIVQGLLFKAVRASNIHSNRKQGEVDAAVAKSLAVIIVTNFCCWFPICVLGFMSLGGYKLSLEMYAWIIVFVLPINAALNPFLYTISSIRKKKRAVDSKTRTSGAVTTNAFLKVYNAITRDGRLIIAPGSMPLSRFLANNSVSKHDVQLIKRRISADIEQLHGNHICHGFISEDTVSVIMENNEISDAYLEFRHKRITENMDSYKDVDDFDSMLERLRRAIPAVTNGDNDATNLETPNSNVAHQEDSTVKQ